MKQRGIIVLSVLLLSLCFTGGRIQEVYGANQTSIREAKSGDAENFNGKGDVDVSGEIGKESSADTGNKTYSSSSTSSSSTSSSSSSSSSSAIKIGGKVNEPTGKTVKTGDVLASSRIVAILFLGVGCLFLIVRKKNHQGSVRE